MSIANYSEMVAAVETWLNREGFTKLQDQIPDFIAFGQRRIMYEAEIQALAEVDSAFSVGTQVVAKPADLLRVRSMTIVTGWGTDEILGAPITQVLSYLENNKPETFAEVGDNFYFGPPPDQTYTVVLQYYKALPILSQANTTNWFTDNYPELLLAASLYEALLWLKDDVRAQVWAQQYTRLKDTLESSERLSRYPSGTAQARLK